MNHKLKTLFVSAILSPLISFGQISSKGLVGYYPFNGNALDASGMANNGTVSGAILTTDKFSTPDNAYSFNGTSSYINLGQPSSLKMKDSISISVWMNVNTVSTAFQPVVSDNGSNQVSVGPGKNLRLAGNKLQFIVAGIYNGSPAATYIESPITAGNWVHAVVTYDKNTIKMYLNNALVASKAYTQSLSVNPNDLLIGKSGQGNEFFNGKMDQIRIYNRAITVEEVKALYEETNKPVITALGTTSLCQGGFVKLIAPKGAQSYKWSNGVIGKDTLSVSEGGSYFVTINGKDTSNTIVVNVDPTIASITNLSEFVNIAAPSFTLNGSPASGVFSGNGISNGKFNPKVAGLGTSLIAYSFIGNAGCTGKIVRKVVVYDTLNSTCSVKDTLFMTIVLGINNTEKENTIKIYPNPASTTIEISNGDYTLMAGYKIEIANPLGQLVFVSDVNQNHFSINVSSWAKNGVYILKLYDSQNNVIENRKIVIQ